MDIGIDLGTTFSVVAVKGKVQFVEGYPEGDYLEECDVTIIPSPDGDMTFPSIFWVDPDNPEEILIGYDAKQKATEGESPIMFSKRSIGTDKVLKIGSHEYTAKYVASKILQHLRSCAEQALGTTVERIVVTHPAYFDPGAIQETKEAAIAAGIDMAQPEQVLMEPTAAALAYLHSVDQDPITVMAFDLGGGTFDVTILEKRDGVSTMKAFDGDPLLGGYNFDKAIVQWIYDKATAKGRKIPYNSGDPEDKSRYERLLMVAESVKIKLSETHTDKMSVQVRAPDILVDDNGKIVPVQERINREEFMKLIQDNLDKTIECCRGALEKAKIEAEGLDMILLVGGSTYGPWVNKTLETAFPGIEIREFEPDKCVAAGAAIQAASLPPLKESGNIRMILDVPRKSALPHINVAGELQVMEPAKSNSALSDLQVFLTLSDDSTLPTAICTQNGMFLFENVELDEDDTSSFLITVKDSDGNALLNENFEVEFDPESEVTTIYNALPKQISIQTARGMVPLAEEGVPLPAKIDETFIRIYEDETTLRIPLFLGDEGIGSIGIDDIPPDVGKNAKVRIEINITQKNEIVGQATISTHTGQERATSKVGIVFPPVRLKTLSELLTEFEDLENERLEQMETCPDRKQRTTLGGKGEKIKERLEKKFSEINPDPQEIQQSLRDFRKLVHASFEDDMTPPHQLFNQTIDTCKDLIKKQKDSPERKSNEDKLERIIQDKERAYADRNLKKWQAAYENAESLKSKLRGGGGISPEELPPTPVMKEQFLLEVEQLRAKLNAKREMLVNKPNYEDKYKIRCDVVERMIDEMEDKINKVDDELERTIALGKLQLAYNDKPQIVKKIETVEFEIEKEEKQRLQ